MGPDPNNLPTPYCYYNERQDSYNFCEDSPCPNRNTVPLGSTKGNENWASEISVNQIAQIVARKRKQQEDANPTTAIELDLDSEPEDSEHAPVPVPDPPAPKPPNQPPPPPPNPDPQGPAQIPDPAPAPSPPPRPNPPPPPPPPPQPNPPTTVVPLPKRKMPDIFKVFSDVPKLQRDGANYRIWVERVNFTAMGCAVKAYLTAAAPADKQDQSDILLAALMGRLPDSIFFTLKASTRPDEIMSALRSRFGQQNTLTNAHAEERLFSLKCTDGAPKAVQAHLDELLTLREELAASDIKISDKTFVNAVISSMPHAYKTVITTHESAVRVHNMINPSALHTITPDAIIALLRGEAQTRATLSASASKPKKPDSANAASHTGGKGKKSGKDRRKDSKKPESSDDSGVTCYRCQGKGHRANVCPSKSKAPRPKDQANAADEKKPDPKSDEKGKGRAVETASIVQIDSDDEDAWAAYSAVEIIEADGPEIATMANDSQISRSEMEVYDSGATKHMTPFRDQLRNYRSVPRRNIKAADEKFFPAYGVGDMHLSVPNGSKWNTLRVKGVLYAPTMGSTLISLGKLDDDGYSMNIGGGRCTISNPDGTQIGSIAKENGLYIVRHNERALAARIPSISLAEIHRRLGHASYGYIRKLVASGTLLGLNVDLKSGEPECDVCLRAKASRKPILSRRLNPRASNFGDVIHMDVWGPAPVQTIHHSLYTCTMLDDATLWLEEPLLRTKGESFAKYVGYEARLFTQFGVRIKCAHSDRGGEFLGNDFTAHLECQGTTRKLTVHDTPEHNGDAERSHLTLGNMRRCMLIASGLPKWLWGEAHKHAVWLWNRTPHAAIGFSTPYEAQFGKKPDLSGLKPFGAVCYVRKEKSDKLGARADEGRWLGFDDTLNGIRVYSTSKNSVSVERNIVVSSREISPLEGEDYSIEMPTIDSIDNERNLITHDPVAQPIEDVNPAEEIQEPVPEGVVTGKRKRKPSSKVRAIMDGKAITGDELDEAHFTIEMNLA
ncbi:hypothetical protein EUX98_g9235, partial [Antrodiella citrinella]